MHKIEFEQINHLYRDCVSAFAHRTLFNLIFNFDDYRGVYNAECRWQLVRCTIQWTLVSRTSRWRSIAQYKKCLVSLFFQDSIKSLMFSIFFCWLGTTTKKSTHCLCQWWVKSRKLNKIAIENKKWKTKMKNTITDNIAVVIEIFRRGKK